MSEMNISVLEAQVAAAGTTVFEIPVRQYPAVETRVFIDVRMVCRTVGMSVNNDFGSILSHGTADIQDPACTTYRRGTKGYDQIRLEPESGLQ